MTSILKTDEIQSQNGGAVVKMQTLKHPSASGNNLELASDGSTTITNGTLSAGTIESSVNFNPAIGQLVFWHGYTSSSITCTLDGTSTYVVLVLGRIESSPYYPINLTFMIDSSDGSITNKTDAWGAALDESFDNSTKVLTLSKSGSNSIMQALIFKGAVTEMT